MNGTFRVASYRGIPIRLHWSFLVALPLLASIFAQRFVAAAGAAGVAPGSLASPWLWGLFVAASLFVSVLVHELAHAIYARRSGGTVADITLLMIGGVSRLTTPPSSARHEALMALAGPLVSLALGAAFLAFAGGVDGVGDASFGVHHALFVLGQLNIALGIFNLLPAFPMDGGRILRSVLSSRLGRERATRIAAVVGRVFAVAFAVVGFLTFNLMLLLIAFFVWTGAEAEAHDVSFRTALSQLRVRDLMSRAPNPASVISLSPRASVAAAADLMRVERRLSLPVVDDGAGGVASGVGAAVGNVVGVVSLDDVRRVPAGERTSTSISRIARAVPVIDADADARAAVEQLAFLDMTELPVVIDGQLAGMLSQGDVMRALQLRKLDETTPPSARPPRPWTRRPAHA